MRIKKGKASKSTQSYWINMRIHSPVKYRHAVQQWQQMNRAYYLEYQRIYHRKYYKLHKQEVLKKQKVYRATKKEALLCFA